MCLHRCHVRLSHPLPGIPALCLYLEVEACFRSVPLTLGFTRPWRTRLVIGFTPTSSLISWTQPSLLATFPLPNPCCSVPLLSKSWHGICLCHPGTVLLRIPMAWSDATQRTCFELIHTLLSPSSFLVLTAYVLGTF